MRKIILIGTLLLAACSPAKPMGKPYFTLAKVVSVDFEAAHRYCHGVKPRHCEDIPDRWDVYYVAPNSEGVPDSFRSDVVPPEWMTPGHTVKLTWQAWDDGYRRLVSETAAE